MLDAIIVIAQYARDQAVVSARDQALAWVSPRRMDHGEHISVWSLQRTVSSYGITILRLPDNNNRRTCLQTSVGGARMHFMHACMRRRADMYSITIIFSYIVIIKKSHQQQETKPIAETKMAQYVHDIELHFTKKVKRTQTRN